MDPASGYSWTHRTTVTSRNSFPVTDIETEGGGDISINGEEYSSTPPPYHLHDLRSPGNVTFIGPWDGRLTPPSMGKEDMDPNVFEPIPIGATMRGPLDSVSLLPSHSVSEEAIQNPAHPSISWCCSLGRFSTEAHRFVRSEPFWLVLYFLFNLSLTLYNKLVLVTFPFPYTLTAIHTLCGSVGCYVLQEYGFYVGSCHLVLLIEMLMNVRLLPG
jgi:hypothetical protein